MPKHQIVLTAGPLCAEFESGDLRYIRAAGEIVLSRIYAAVRDRNWNTIPGIIDNEVIEVESSSFRICYLSRHQAPGINFIWNAEIVGDSSGQIIFRFNGECLGDLEKNRIGFCVLHPLSLSGKACELQYVNGEKAPALFPEAIAAEQPISRFSNLRAISHKTASGATIEVHLDGDTFETEDQRNWIDASFKTYCTPLSDSFPVRLTKGTRIQQTITVSIRGDVETPASRSVKGRTAQDLVIFSPSKSVFKDLPLLGWGLSSKGPPLSTREARRLRQLSTRHVRIDLGWPSLNWREPWDRSLLDASALGCKIEVALHIGESGEFWLQECLDALGAKPNRVARIFVFTKGAKATTQEVWKATKCALRNLGIPLYVGTNADFYQLGLSVPPFAEADGVVWSMNPQVHASDWRSISETPSAVPSQLATARMRYGDKLTAVSPVTLKPRFNPVATAAEESNTHDGLPAEVDARQTSLNAAGWAVAMIGKLAFAEATSVTFFETKGWKGLFEDDLGGANPNSFRSIPGGLFPLYHVFRYITEHARSGLRMLESSDESLVAGLELSDDEGAHWVFSNLSNRPMPSDLSILPLGAVQALRLTQSNLDEAGANEDSTSNAGCFAPFTCSPSGICYLEPGEILILRPA